MDNSKLPAFPLHPNHDSRYVDYEGLTKREHFAGLAMQGLLSSFTENAAMGLWTTEIEELASTSVQLADALLLALNQEK